MRNTDILDKLDDYEGLDSLIKEIRSEITDLRDQKKEWEKEKKTLEKWINDLETETELLTENLEEKRTEYDELEAKFNTELMGLHMTQGTSPKVTLQNGHKVVL